MVNSKRYMLITGIVFCFVSARAEDLVQPKNVGSVMQFLYALVKACPFDHPAVRSFGF